MVVISHPSFLLNPRRTHRGIKWCLWGFGIRAMLESWKVGCPGFDLRFEGPLWLFLFLFAMLATEVVCRGQRV